MTKRIEGSQTYTQTFDLENRLASVQSVSGTTTFIYNGDSARVLQIKPNGSKVAYLGFIEVELTGTQRITTTYYQV